MRQNLLSHIMELDIADLLIRADKRTVHTADQFKESKALEKLRQIRSKNLVFIKIQVAKTESWHSQNGIHVNFYMFSSL